MSAAMHFVANVQKLVDREFEGRVNAAARSWRIPQRTLASILSHERSPSLKTAEEISRSAGYALWQLIDVGFDPANPPKMVPFTAEQWNWYSRVEELRVAAMQQADDKGR